MPSLIQSMNRVVTVLMGCLVGRSNTAPSYWLPAGEPEGTVSWTVALPVREGAEEKVKEHKKKRKRAAILKHCSSSVVDRHTCKLFLASRSAHALSMSQKKMQNEVSGFCFVLLSSRVRFYTMKCCYPFRGRFCNAGIATWFCIAHPRSAQQSTG